MKLFDVVELTVALPGDGPAPGDTGPARSPTG
ncbi:hypothetical protein FHX44_112037 [Pseudonocardia hierapolitana]|uniref:Uncharacterized protein n=1 Tax=Pseudonocardia hierapolitana TaxID=1128676 RepID=A0A561SMQ7_9PSEU|nr:hypothetical protein FHX44_112037 [Pseudonocardia hierapolitana]